MLTRILTANKNQIRMVSAILCKIWYQKVHFLILFDFSSVPIDKSDNIVYDFTRYLLKSVGLQVIYFTKVTICEITKLSIFPKELVIRFNDGVDYSDFEISSFLGNKSEEIIEHLDDQAKGAIRAMVMMEYARCNSITNDAVIKSLGVITK